MTVTPFYLDWTFWAVVIAGTALILSQFPPLHRLLKPARINMELYQRICLTHRLGNPNAQIQLIVSNVGGRSVRVRGVNLEFERDSRDRFVIGMQSYLQNPNDDQAVLSTPFRLAPNSDWSHIANFFSLFDRNEEQRIRRLTSVIKSEIAALRKNGDGDRLVEVSDDSVQPFLDAFDANFKWEPGEYKMIVKIIVEPVKSSKEREYRFTVFESDTEDLRRQTEKYKYGDGIYFDSQTQQGVTLNLREHDA